MRKSRTWQSCTFWWHSAMCSSYLFAPLSSLGPTHISKFSSGEPITTTSIHIAMTSKGIPRLVEFVSHERASTAGNGSCPNFGHCECYCLLSGHLRNEVYSLCSLRQISKGIHREASQGVRGSGDSGHEQRKGWPLQGGSRVLEYALDAVPGYFVRGMQFVFSCDRGYI